MKAVFATIIAPRWTMLFAACMVCVLFAGCGLWRRPNANADSATAKETPKKKSWLEALRMDHLRDERAIEVERHLGGGI